MIDAFQAGCGLQSPIALTVTEGDTPRSAHFDRPFVIIGRSPSSCLQLDNNKVSYRHAYLQVVAGRIFCVDLGSRCGIFWGGKKRHRGWLETGQPFQIGPYTLSIAPFQTASILPAM